MKLLFRRPELLLLLAILAGPLIISNSALDIQLHDTSFVFGKTSWGFNAIFTAIGFLLLITLVIHVLARKYNWLPLTWRWAQVALTLILMTAMIKALQALLVQMDNTSSILGFNRSAFGRFLLPHKLFGWALLLLVFSQPVFWLTTIIIALWRRQRNPR
jgi:hypothetical protein